MFLSDLSFSPSPPCPLPKINKNQSEGVAGTGYAGEETVMSSPSWRGGREVVSKSLSCEMSSLRV